MHTYFFTFKKTLIFFRCPFLWVHRQFRIWCFTFDEFCEPLLVAIVGRYPEPLQEYGTMGVLFLQISPSWLPIRSSFSRLSCSVWWWIPIDSWKTVAWMAYSCATFCNTGIDHIFPWPVGHCLPIATSTIGVDTQIWMAFLRNSASMQRCHR